MSEFRVIQCPGCTTKLKLPTTAATVKCPKCSKLLKLSSTADATSSPKASTPTTKPVPSQPAAAAVTIKCSSCASLLKAPASSAGKSIKCPKCATILKVPGGNQPSNSSSAPAQRPVAAPKPSAPVDDPFADLGSFGGSNGGLSAMDFGGLPGGPAPSVPSQHSYATTPYATKPASAQSRTASAKRPMGSGAKMLLIYGGVAFFSFMFGLLPLVNILLPIACICVFAVCQIWILINAFQDDLVQGLLVWFVPFYVIYYVLTNYEKNRIPTLLFLGSLLAFVCSFAGMIVILVIFSAVSASPQAFIWF